MRMITVGEISRMVTNTAFSFSDTCTLNIKSVSRNEFGEEEPTYSSGSNISCGFELVGGDEAHTETIITLGTVGKFRLPIDSVISFEDRITLTKRYDKTVSYIFEVISEPVKNLDCITLNGKCISV